MSPVVAPGFTAAIPPHHRLIRHFDQPFGLARDRADRIHAAGIAIPAVDDEGDVDVDDVALFQRTVAGHAVADHVVERGAGRVAVAAIHQRRRIGIVAEGEVADELVDALGRHAGPDDVGELVEALRHQRSRLAHAGKGARSVQLDLSGLAQGGIGSFDVTHAGAIFWGGLDIGGKA
ncbi:hypothetical protein ACVWW2_000393 [Bradyrhizobium sp. LM4.3]